MSYEYDMVVIGGGSAGLTAAGMSALLGAKTLLVEAHRMGGECTWTGCIPSKTLLQTAKMVYQARTTEPLFAFGGEPGKPWQVDFARVAKTVNQTREQIYRDADAPPNLEKLGVKVAHGTASFLNPHAIEIAAASGPSERVSSRYFVIATGSRPRELGFSVPVLTNESVFELTSLPARLAVIGAGPEGIELAQAFRRLGSQVRLIASGAHILPKDDPELTGQLQAGLQSEGVEFLFGVRSSAAQKCKGHIELTLDDGRRIGCDAILAAIGREPSIQLLRLENAGVQTDQHGIHIDNHCRTSARHIFACGDVTGKYQFTHMAEHMSKVAVTNALLRYPQSIDEAHVVWCTYTDPELARLGKSEAELKKAGARYSVYRFPFSKIDRAITDGETAGLIKVLAGRKGRILGVTIFGAHAGEMICEWALAMRHGLKLSAIASTIHPYPTYLLGNRRAADQWQRRWLASPLLGLLGRVMGYRGTRKLPSEL